MQKLTRFLNMRNRPCASKRFYGKTKKSNCTWPEECTCPADPPKYPLRATQAKEKGCAPCAYLRDQLRKDECKEIPKEPCPKLVKEVPCPQKQQTINQCPKKSVPHCPEGDWDCHSR